MDFIRQNKKYVVIFSVAIIIVIIALVGTKIYEKKNIIQTSRKDEESELPNIKIESKNISALNNELERLYKKYVLSGRSKFNYKTYYYNDTISLLVDIDEYIEENKTYQKKFLGYNIDKKGNYLSEEEIASMFNTNMSAVKDKVLEKLRFYYNEEDRLEYLVKEECDFSCYLNFVRNIDNIMDHIALIIEDNQLVAYVSFDKNSFYEDREYFDSLDYDVYKVIIK